jgi:hypothetical protein
MKSPWIRLLLLVMILSIMAPWLLPGYASAEVRDWNQLDDPLYEALGVHGGMSAGFGLSYKFPIQHWLYAQATGAIWNTKSHKWHNMGFELEYVLRQAGRDKLYLDAGLAYYYNKDDGEADKTLNSGFGVGLERLMGERWSVQVQLDFTYWDAEDSLMMFPQLGLYYYF